MWQFSVSGGYLWSPGMTCLGKATLWGQSTSWPQATPRAEQEESENPAMAAIQKQQDHLRKEREGLRPLTALPDSGRSCLRPHSPKPHTAGFSLL